MTHTTSKTYSGRNYFAPTVYLQSGRQLSGVNYYNTLADAIRKYKFLSGSGGSDVAPAGYISFANRQISNAVTVGINCDFFALQNGVWEFVTYAYLKSLGSRVPPVIFRFQMPGATGIYYAIFAPNYFGLSATSTPAASADVVAALDEFFRQVSVLQHTYNALAAFANELANYNKYDIGVKLYNESLLKLQELEREMKQIQGITFIYQGGTALGAIPVLILLAGIAIFSTAAAWSVSSIYEESQKTKRINDSFALQKWVSDQKVKVSELLQSGKISDAMANEVNNDLSGMQKTADNVANRSAKSMGFFSGLSNILPWLAVGGLAYLFLNKKL